MLRPEGLGRAQLHGGGFLLMEMGEMPTWFCHPTEDNG